jgi:phenylalanine-4-hydroxylase
MKQLWNNYSEENHGTWNILYVRQTENLIGKVWSPYHQLLRDVLILPEEIPRFENIDTALLNKTGWTIEVVPGIIPVKEFFDLLAAKKFCSSTWLRRRDQLDYLEEPDMFHDTFGHLPFLMHEGYSKFVQEFGKLGQKYHDNPDAVLLLERLYWFTIEFGLVREDNRTKLFGAGIISSFGETNHVFNNNVEIREFTVENVLMTPFRNDQVQQLYFEAKDAETVFNCIPETEKFIRDFINGKYAHRNFDFESQTGSMVM